MPESSASVPQIHSLCMSHSERSDNKAASEPATTSKEWTPSTIYLLILVQDRVVLRDLSANSYSSLPRNQTWWPPLGTLPAYNEETDSRLGIGCPVLQEPRHGFWCCSGWGDWYELGMAESDCGYRHLVSSDAKQLGYSSSPCLKLPVHPAASQPQ